MFHNHTTSLRQIKELRDRGDSCDYTWPDVATYLYKIIIEEEKPRCGWRERDGSWVCNYCLSI